MKKFLIGLGIVAISTSSFAITKEEFYYQMGYEKAKKIYYEKGLRDAFKIIKKRLEAYKKDLQALEVGKYLYKNQLVTFPRVYRLMKDDGTVEIKVLGCRIEDLRNIDKILTEGINIPTFTEKEIKEVSTGNDIIKLDEPETLPSDEITHPIHLSLKKTGFVKEALEKYNVPYEETEKEYRAVFFSKEDLERFCKTTKVCGM